MKVNWIKCSDRLPEPYKSVWIFISNGTFKNDVRVAFTCKYKRNYVFSSDGCLLDLDEEVTHWAEIEYPDAPEVDDGK